MAPPVGAAAHGGYSFYSNYLWHRAKWNEITVRVFIISWSLWSTRGQIILSAEDLRKSDPPPTPPGEITRLEERNGAIELGEGEDGYG